MDESELDPNASPIEVGAGRDSLHEEHLEILALRASLRIKEEELNRDEQRLDQLRETSEVLRGATVVRAPLERNRDGPGLAAAVENS